MHRSAPALGAPKEHARARALSLECGLEEHPEQLHLLRKHCNLAAAAIMANRPGARSAPCASVAPVLGAGWGEPGHTAADTRHAHRAPSAHGLRWHIRAQPRRRRPAMFAAHPPTATGYVHRDGLQPDGTTADDGRRQRARPACVSGGPSTRPGGGAAGGVAREEEVPVTYYLPV
ncbi:hypothetical protein B0H10DRAFT_2220746 [Mycena sp. CBHHK59/15]|nr:hypothetical protein B0H10DRAFT_2220746 [Mycena sp. CBHHK59/15]